MGEGLANIRRIDVDVAGLASWISGRGGTLPLAVEELDVDWCGRHGDVERRQGVYME
jgi:hypothetical protein